MRSTIILFFILIASSCSEYKTSNKKELVIFYGNIKKITYGSWIKIDNHKFVHTKEYKISDIKRKERELPTKMITLQKIKGRELKENVNHVILLKILYSKLTKIDNNYYTPNPLSVISKGMLILRKRDGTSIRFSTSEGYPISQNP